MTHWNQHKVVFDADVWRNAQQRSTTPLFNREFKTVQRNEGAAVMGALGECVTEFWLDWHGVDWLPDGNYENDLLVAGKRAEIKTKLRTTIPQGHFEASVNNYGDWIQKPDLFIFVSLFRTGSNVCDVNSFSCAYMVGWCYEHELHQFGQQINIGDIDERNGIVFRAESMNIEHRFLRDMNKIGEWAYDTNAD